MDPLVLIVIGVVAMVLPIALFLGLVGLALFLWCAKRIWPIPRAIGKWAGQWRNFVPLAFLVFVLFIMAILPAVISPDAMMAMMIAPAALFFGLFMRFPLAGLLLLGFGFIAFLASIVWIVKFARWFWRVYTRFFWWMFQIFPWTWDLLWRRIPGGIESTLQRATRREEAVAPKPVPVVVTPPPQVEKPKPLPRERPRPSLSAGFALMVLRVRRILNRIWSGLRGALSGFIGFFKRNGLLLALPFFLVAAVIGVGVAMPFIPLYALFALSFLGAKRVFGQIRGGRDEDLDGESDEPGREIPGVGLLRKVLGYLGSILEKLGLK